MKTHLRKILAGAAVICALFMTAGLSSCSDNDGWYPEHPDYYPNTFFDRNLTGVWRLVSDNSIPVEGTAVNYLDFYGNGNGRYYFYSNGAPTSVEMYYGCVGVDSAVTQTQLNLQYGNGTPTSMLYWFTPNRLWLQWTSGSGVHTYAYAPVGGAPW